MEKYGLLLNHKDPTYDKYSEEIDRASQERRDVLNDYRQKESDAARRHHDGTVYQIELDYEHDLLKLEDSMTDYIRCKYELLKGALPDAAKYFREYTECPFIKAMTAGDRPNEENMSIELSKDPLVTEQEFETALAEARLREKKCVIDGTSIVYEGVVFQEQSLAILINGKSNPMKGTIREVRQKYILFDLNDGRCVRVPVQALILGMCELRKQ